MAVKTAQKPVRPGPAKRRLYAVAAIMSFVAFVAGLYLMYTEYSGSHALFYLGFFGLGPVGLVAFVVFAIKWHNAGHHRQAPPPNRPNGAPVTNGAH